MKAADSEKKRKGQNLESRGGGAMSAAGRGKIVAWSKWGRRSVVRAIVGKEWYAHTGAQNETSRSHKDSGGGVWLRLHRAGRDEADGIRMKGTHHSSTKVAIPCSHLLLRSDRKRFILLVDKRDDAHRFSSNVRKEGERSHRDRRQERCLV